MKALLVLCTLAFLCLRVDALTASDLTSIDSIIRSTIRGTNIATMVRLAFHDCVGGCNGCININNEDNAGLPDLVATLDTLYTSNNLDAVLTRADFWAYCSYFALNRAVTIANNNCDADDCAMPDLGLVFQYGRTDCTGAPYSTDDVGLPSPHLEYSDLVDFFFQEFGFSDTETIALMGAHTLGSMKEENSGFKGAWTTGETNWLNNNYYSLLAGGDFNRRNSGDDDEPRWQWSHDSALGNMLNADMCMFKDVILDEEGKSSCLYDACADSPGAATVQTYAASNAVWAADFAAVFQKMVTHGYTSLTDITS